VAAPPTTKPGDSPAPFPSRSAATHAVRKRFGQHFLQPEWAAKVLNAVAPERHQTFIEIGPGRGAITTLLASRANRLVAYEIDRDLAPLLREMHLPRVEVIQRDFLAVDSQRIREDLDLASPGILRIVGNLPYNVASPILFKLVRLFGEGLPIADATVMLQREVANRLLASPGSKDYGVLTVLIGIHATGERLLQIPPGAFRPPPRVQSTLVRLRFHPPDPVIADLRALEALTQALFTRRRKTLANALLAYAPAARRPVARLLSELGLDPQRRPETLTIQELARLADAV
jgi:16S rRNA (adenine1518-N6/adenine1519-N6)-dimethyltransferase